MKKNLLSEEEIGSVAMSLSHLLHAGIGPADALVLLREDEPDAGKQAVFARMADLADAGATLSSAMDRSGCFPREVCALLAVGEAVGKTEQTLTALSGFYRERAALQRQIRSAVLYPTMLLGVLLAVVVILLVWVLPIFDTVYAQLGSHLTGLAGGLLVLGDVLRTALPYLCVFPAVLAVGLAIPPLRMRLFSLLRRFGGDRGVSALTHNARFLQALTMATHSGMLPKEAICLAASVYGDAAFTRRTQKSLAALEAGASLPRGLQAGGFLTASDSRLLDAGIRSGQSDAVLADITHRSTDLARDALVALVGKIEPALVTVSCVLIGAVLLSVMLPLLQIITAIG